MDFLDKLPDAALDFMNGRKLDEVECIVADLSGIARGKAMPALKFAKQKHFYLPNSIFLQSINGDWVDDEDAPFTEYVPLQQTSSMLLR